MFVAVLLLQPYLLYDIEQGRVLVYESDKIWNQISVVGGIADFVALFIQQFFHIAWMGALAMAILYGLMALCIQQSYALMKNNGEKNTLAENIICWLPAVLLFAYTEDRVFFVNGHASLLIAAIGLYIGLKVNRYIQCLVIVVVGFAAGVSVWPMIIVMLVHAILVKKKYLQAVAMVATAVLMTVLARRASMVYSSDEMFSPNIFTYRARVETLMPWIWVALVVIASLPLLLRRVKSSIISNTFTACAILFVVVAVGINAFKSHHSDETNQRLEVQYWMDKGEYDKAYDFSIKYLNNPFCSNLFAMIVSQQKDALAGSVGHSIKVPEQLIMNADATVFIRRHMMNLYYHVGYVNGAQCQAFEYNEPSEGMMRPSALQILAKTNIIQGCYGVADKYLTHLENTLFYKEWAQQYKKFLYNDKAVEADPELGPRRKTLVMESVPDSWTKPQHILNQIATLAPELPATEYVKAYGLLGAYK